MTKIQRELNVSPAHVSHRFYRLYEAHWNSRSISWYTVFWPSYGEFDINFVIPNFDFDFDIDIEYIVDTVYLDGVYSLYTMNYKIIMSMLPIYRGEYFFSFFFKSCELNCQPTTLHIVIVKSMSINTLQLTQTHNGTIDSHPNAFLSIAVFIFPFNFHKFQRFNALLGIVPLRAGMCVCVFVCRAWIWCECLYCRCTTNAFIRDKYNISGSCT